MHDGRDLVAGRGRVSTKSRPSRHGQGFTGESGLARDGETIARRADPAKWLRANVSPREQILRAAGHRPTGEKTLDAIHLS